MTTQRRTKSTEDRSQNGATTGYESQLWQMADALRGSMDAAEYKHVVLGLLFLKYVSDAFEEARAALETEVEQGANPEDPDEYRAEGHFWVPDEARWEYLKSQARQPTIGVLVDHAMSCIERDNPSLKDVLPKDYGRPNLDKQSLGRLIDLISDMRLAMKSQGRKTCWGVSTSIFSPCLRAQRANAAVSFTRHDASSTCWSRCWNRIEVGYSIRVAVLVGCSCSPSTFIDAHSR